MTVQVLLDIGAEVNWKDSAGCTALTWVMLERHENVVRLLLENGTNVNSKEIYNYTPCIRCSHTRK